MAASVGGIGAKSTLLEAVLVWEKIEIFQKSFSGKVHENFVFMFPAMPGLAQCPSTLVDWNHLLKFFQCSSRTYSASADSSLFSFGSLLATKFPKDPEDVVFLSFTTVKAWKKVKAFFHWLVTPREIYTQSRRSRKFFNFFQQFLHFQAQEIAKIDFQCLFLESLCDVMD